MVSPTSFNRILARWGKDVVIIHRTPQLVSGIPIKDSRGHTVYNEEEVDIRCTLYLTNARDEFVRNAILEVGDAVAHFKISDQEYIQTDNSLKTTINGKDYEFQMIGRIDEKTHIKVPMKRLEI